MANVLQFGEEAAAPAANGKKNPPAKFWINVGVWVDLPAPDGNGTVKEFINLPLGIPMDQMKVEAPKGDNARWNKIVNTRNQLITALHNKFGSMEPGTQDIVNGLSVQVSRAKDKVETVYDAEEATAALNISFG